jgi:hypothetical protein
MPRQIRQRITLPVSVVLFFMMVVLCVLPGAMAQAPADTTVAPAAAAAMKPEPPLPATHVRVSDVPNDHGHSLMVVWEASPDDGAGRNDVLAYRIERTPRFEGPLAPDSATPGGSEFVLFHSAVYGEAVWHIVPGTWDTVAQVPAGGTTYDDRGGKDRTARDFLPDYTDFRYRVITTTALRGESTSEPSAPAQASAQWFHIEKIQHIGIPVAVFTALVLGFIAAAKRGRELYIRPLSGISAVDEAIGRATEMNRPILYVLGLGAADDIATIASLTILARVARRVAEHRTELVVPCYDPVVMSIAQETVKQAYLDAGRPDEYKEEQVHYVTQDQFAYVAAVNGTMLRRQTATNFYLGVFFAESLILAETGSIAGSIQISGTDRTTQLPFFIVACDYTLIGEELYAASAYLGREPKLLGTLKGQDWAKVIFIAATLLGVAGAAFQVEWIVSMFQMNF